MIYYCVILEKYIYINLHAIFFPITKSNVTMEGDGDFFIYLRSDFNRDEYKENKTCKFTNIISPNIVLNGRYEIGVRNLIFTPDFYVVKKGDRNFGINVEISFYDPHYKLIHSSLFDYNPSYKMKTNDVTEFISKYDKDFNLFLKTNNIVKTDYNQSFSYKKNDARIKFNPIDINSGEMFLGDKSEGYLVMVVKFKIGDGIQKYFGIETNDFLMNFISPPMNDFLMNFISPK